MVEKTQAFYKKYYGYSLSKENAEQILKGLSLLSSIFNLYIYLYNTYPFLTQT